MENLSPNLTVKTPKGINMHSIPIIRHQSLREGQVAKHGTSARQFTGVLVLLAAFMLTTANGFAQSLYWDINGSTAGAGGASPSGTWDGITPNWNNSAGTGTPGDWVSGDTAVFSAGSDATGSYSVTISGTETATGITFEDGTNTLTSGTLNLTGGGLITVNAAPAKGIIASAITGTAGLTKTSSGELVLQGANTFTGNLTNKSGTITLDNNQAAGGGAIVLSPSSPVILHSSQSLTTLTNNISMQGNTSTTTELDADSGKTLVFNGLISGTHNWNANGPGTLKLGGTTANTFGGVLTVQQGTVVVATDGALGGTVNDAVVNTGATISFAGGITYLSNKKIDLNGTGVSGGAALDNTSDDNYFHGTVNLMANSAIGAQANSTLSLIGPVIGGFNLTKTGNGVIILSSSANSYGTTLVSAGTLAIAAGGSGGSGLVTVNSGAIFAGEGVAASGGINLSGMVSPGQSLPATLTSGSVIWQAGGSYDWTINDALGTPGGDPGYALLNITNTGTLTINATSGNPFVIHVSSLNSSLDLPGFANNFDNTQQYSWIIATASGGISGFDPSAFTIDASGLAGTTGFYNDMGNGAFILQQSGNNINLNFVQKPQISSGGGLSDQTGIRYGSVTFSVSGTGSGTLHYQWYHNSTPVGTDSSALTLNNLNFSDAGTYSVTISNISGFTASSSANLSVVKATPTVVATGGTFTYDGASHAGSGVATGGASESLSVTLSYGGTGSTTYGPTPTAPTAAGTYTVTASTVGDANNQPGTSSPDTLTINKATPSVTVIVGSYTYTGSPQGPNSVTTSPVSTGSVTWSYAGGGYGPSSTPPTAAGSYTATATVAADDNNNQSSSSATAFAISTATPTVTVTVGSYTYTGSPQGPNSVTTSPISTGSVTWSYAGSGYGPSSTPPTVVGSYTATATVAADSNNNQSSSSATAFAITKATPGVVVTSPTTFVYTGSPQGPNSVSTSPVSSGAVTWSYTGDAYGPSATPPTAVGSYTAAVTVAADDNNDQNSTSTGFTITPATPGVTVNGPLLFTYNASAQGPASVTTVPVSTGAVTWTYTGVDPTTYGPSTDLPAAAGTYTAAAAVAADANNFAAVSSPTAFAIGQATNMIALVSSENASTYGDDVTFTATVQTNYLDALATAGDATGNIIFAVDGTPVATVPINNGAAAFDTSGLSVPSHVISVTYAGDNNYSNNVTTPTLTQTVNQATPVVFVDSEAFYNGSPQGADFYTSTAGSISNIRYNGSATIPTAAGFYDVTVDFTPDDTTDFTSLTDFDAEEFIIWQDSPDIEITSPTTFVYTGSPQGPNSVSTSPVSSGAVTWTYTGDAYGPSATPPTAVGSYTAAVTVAADDNNDQNSTSTGFTITPATPGVTVNGPLLFTYNASAQGPASVTTVPVSTGAVTWTYTGVDPTTYGPSTDLPAAAGTYTAAAAVAADANNFAAVSSPTAFAIGQATNMIALVSSENASTYGDDVTFTATVQTNYLDALATAGDATGNIIFAVDGTPVATVPINNGAAAFDTSGLSVPSHVISVTYAGDNNYSNNVTTPTLTQTVNQATPVVFVDSEAFYNGSPQGADFYTSTAGSISNIRYNGSATIPTAAGFYDVTVDFTPDDTTDFTSLTDFDAEEFIIWQDSPDIEITSPTTFVYTGSPQGPNSVSTSPVSSGAVTWTYTGDAYGPSATPPTAVGSYTAAVTVAADDNNDQNSTSTGFTITPATPGVTVNGPLLFTYNASAQGPASVTTVPVSTGAVTWTYTGVDPTTYGPSTDLPAAAGTYTAAAAVAADANNFAAVSSPTAFSIGQATNMIALVSSENASTYGDDVTFTATVQTNYLDALATAGDATGNIIFAVDGTPVATVPINNGAAAFDTSGLSVPSHVISVTYAGDNNYSNNVTTPTLTQTVNQATPVVFVDSEAFYNGSPQGADFYTSTAGSISNIRYNGSATIPTAAGFYDVTVDFTPDDTTDFTSLTDFDAEEFIIWQDSPDIEITSPTTFVYTGSPQGPNSVSTSPVSSGAVTWSYTGDAYGPSATPPTAVGSYTAAVTRRRR